MEKKKLFLIPAIMLFFGLTFVMASQSLNFTGFSYYDLNDAQALAVEGNDVYVVDGSTNIAYQFDPELNLVNSFPVTSYNGEFAIGATLVGDWLVIVYEDNYDYIATTPTITGDVMNWYWKSNGTVYKENITLDDCSGACSNVRGITNTGSGSFYVIDFDGVITEYEISPVSGNGFQGRIGNFSQVNSQMLWEDIYSDQQNYVYAIGRDYSRPLSLRGGNINYLFTPTIYKFNINLGWTGIKYDVYYDTGNTLFGVATESLYYPNATTLWTYSAGDQMLEKWDVITTPDPIPAVTGVGNTLSKDTLMIEQTQLPSEGQVPVAKVSIFQMISGWFQNIVNWFKGLFH